METTRIKTKDNDLSSGKVYVDYRIKTSYSIIGLYTATNFITLSALPWVLPGDILKALAKIKSWAESSNLIDAKKLKLTR